MSAAALNSLVFMCVRTENNENQKNSGLERKNGEKKSNSWEFANCSDPNLRTVLVFNREAN